MSAQFDLALNASHALVPSAVVTGQPGLPPRSYPGMLNFRAPPGAPTSILGPWLPQPWFGALPQNPTS